MKCFGVVAEFNPFHNGHAALCKAARDAGATHVIAVMSGNFVQRGSIAVTDKYVRSGAALNCGCDLVIELPLAAAVAPAKRFAMGAVRLLHATRCVDTLFFGSEAGDIDPLKRAAGAVGDPAVQAAARVYLASGMTFAKARQLAVEAVYGPEIASVLAEPNNNLAVEYIRAAEALGWRCGLHTIPRVEAAHDSDKPGAGVASASYLRTRPGELGGYVPEAAMAVYIQAREDGLYPADPAKLETAILAALRRMGIDELAALPDVSEGLEGRLYRAIRASGSLAELEMAAKTKRYTLARIRRLIMSAFLGITAEDAAATPPYIHVLGFNKGGAELLSRMKDAALPVHTSLARLERISPECARAARLEAAAGDVYSLALPRPRPCGEAYRAKAVSI
jgi:predicted nucleotidyltransferase